MAEPTDDELMAAAAELQQAADLARSLGVDLAQFEAYSDAGMPDLAYEALRQGAAERDMPFGFFMHLSKAADLLGLRP